MSLQDLTRLLAQYRRRLNGDDSLNAAELLRALIAEIEGQRSEREPPKDLGGHGRQF